MSEITNLGSVFKARQQIVRYFEKSIGWTVCNSKFVNREIINGKHMRCFSLLSLSPTIITVDLFPLCFVVSKWREDIGLYEWAVSRYRKNSTEDMAQMIASVSSSIAIPVGFHDSGFYSFPIKLALSEIDIKKILIATLVMGPGKPGTFRLGYTDWLIIPENILASCFDGMSKIKTDIGQINYSTEVRKIRI